MACAHPTSPFVRRIARTLGRSPIRCLTHSTVRIRCGRWACESRRLMVEQRENQTIRSNVSPATARRVIRAHIRTPLAGLAWSLGIPQGDMLVGFVLRRRLHASLVPRATTLGRLPDGLVVRGRTIARQDGGCEVRLSVYRPRFFRVIVPIGIATFSAAFIAGYIATGRTVFLFALGVGVIWQLYNLAIRRRERSPGDTSHSRPARPPRLRIARRKHPQLASPGRRPIGIRRMGIRRSGIRHILRIKPALSSSIWRG
jgi:hypothetical protein